jgi:hypothetical protein
MNPLEKTVRRVDAVQQVAVVFLFCASPDSRAKPVAASPVGSTGATLSRWYGTVVWPPASQTA